MLQSYPAWNDQNLQPANFAAILSSGSVGGLQQQQLNTLLRQQQQQHHHQQPNAMHFHQQQQQQQPNTLHQQQQLNSFQQPNALLQQQPRQLPNQFLSVRSLPLQSTQQHQHQPHQQNTDATLKMTQSMHGALPHPNIIPSTIIGNPNAFAMTTNNGLMTNPMMTMNPMNGFGMLGFDGMSNPTNALGNKGGVGILFRPDAEKNIVVTKVVPNGPAMRTGRVQVGDIVLEVDGHYVHKRPISDIQPLVQGPQGTVVTLKLQKKSGHVTQVAIPREWTPSSADLSDASGADARRVISQIGQGLFLCDAVSVRDLGALQRRGIRAIVNCAEECGNYHQGALHSAQFLLTDSAKEKIHPVLGEACSFIHNHISQGNGVVIHCAQGKSRSATVCIAYLVYTGMSLRDAVHQVKAKRPWVRPNSGFFKQLCAFEKQIRKKSTLSPDYYDSIFPK